MDDLFRHNYSLLEKKNPITATLLINRGDKSGRVHFCYTDLEEINLACDKGGNYFHDIAGAANEATLWRQSLNIQDVNVLYVYGIGLGYYYYALKQWLDESCNHKLVFVEDDIDVLYHWLQTEQATACLINEQVQVVFIDGWYDTGDTLDTLLWWGVSEKFEISALRYYQAAKGREYRQLHLRMMYVILSRTNIINEFSGLGSAFFDNVYSNLLLLPQTYNGKSLFGSFKDVPAIICGAGPSLKKNIHLLKDLQDKALIIAGGGAISALTQQGISPHLGVAIDPTANECARLNEHTCYELPIFYRPRLYYDAIASVHGPRLFLNGAAGYRLCEWLNEHFGIQEDGIEEGHSCITFAMSIASSLGCNPIVFIGVDLAFSEGERYHSDVVRKVLGEVDNDNTKKWEGYVLRNDIYGEEIKTLWKWVAESSWIGMASESFAEVNCINSTEGGIGFPFVENMPLKEVSQQYLVNDYDIKQYLATQIAQGQWNDAVSLPNIQTQLALLFESVNRCLDVIDIILEEIDLLAQKRRIVTKPTGRWSLAEMDLLAEPAYEYIFKNSNELIGHMLHAKNCYVNKKEKSNWLADQAYQYALLRKAAAVQLDIIL